MAYATNGDVAIRYEVEGGSGGAAGEAIVLCGDVGLGAWQFGWQHGALAGPRPVITPELRGIGRSDAPPGPYTVEELADDLDAVLRAEGVRSAHVVGYGLGGMVALAYGERSGRPDSLAVVGTPASGDDYAAERVWADPNDADAVRASTAGLLSPEFVRERPDVVDRIVDWRVAEDATPATFAAQRDAVYGFDRADRLYELTTPTLVVHGRADAVCPVTAGESLAAGLPRGEFHAVEGASHLVGVEASAAINDALAGWLAEHGDDPFA
ncbi:alpha/beta fold hydrolase [Halorubrum sp. JWXQ-INN 858]|uniref:alpha/beta fold hydrolase n=1 Tax=Halorubrum sp. JWXQ-INN 858 TaxID=2690782 RepID=UPI0013F80766|nr:alpha/beta hydrolase [Halorubrum sp. JWXQ-INN 858]MWV65542.1 alpha/beta fold hydrolase [Halorubrum sp. JWXQ-INN 858]